MLPPAQSNASDLASPACRRRRGGGLRDRQNCETRGVTSVRTPVRAQRANAIAEHWIGSLLRECLDHLLITGPRHLAAVLQEAPGPGPRSSGAV
jgi:transposase InsO family protein